MPKEPEPIIIKDFHKAIAASALTGFQDMRNLDPFSVPGSVWVNFRMAKASGTTVTDTPKWIVKDPNGSYYALGDSGKVYTSATGTGSWSVVAGNTIAATPTGQGLIVWKDYLFVFRKQLLDVYGPLSGAAAWSNGWKTLKVGDNDWHPAIIGSDDRLYYGDGRYVGFIEEATAPFAPGTGASYTFNDSALTLPAQYRVKCLAQLADKLMAGTIVGTQTYGGSKVADIFPWDRNSTSFNRPISFNETGVHQMIVKDNVLTAIAGLQATIYRTNGTRVQRVRQLPANLFTLFTGGLFVSLYPGAIMVHKGRVWFGVSSGTNGAGEQGLGIHSVGDDDSLIFENQISTDTTTNTNNLFISALLSIGSDAYLAGWRDDTSYGVDGLESTRYGSYKAYFDDALRQVGLPNRRRSFSECTITLARPFATSGQAIRIKYRTNPTAAYSTLGTFEYDTDGAKYSKTIDAAAIADAEFVQIRAEFSEAGSTPFSPKEIRLE